LSKFDKEDPSFALSLSALTLLVGQQEEHSAGKTSCCGNSQSGKHLGDAAFHGVIFRKPQPKAALCIIFVVIWKRVFLLPKIV